MRLVDDSISTPSTPTRVLGDLLERADIDLAADRLIEGKGRQAGGVGVVAVVVGDGDAEGVGEPPSTERITRREPFTSDTTLATMPAFMMLIWSRIFSSWS